MSQTIKEPHLEYDISTPLEALLTLSKTPPPEGRSRWLVAVSGIPASGKSSIATSLVQRLNQVYQQTNPESSVKYAKDPHNPNGEIATVVNMDG